MALIIMPPKELWEAYSSHTVRPSRFVSGPIYFEVNSQIWCVDACWDGGVSGTILTSILGFRIFVSYVYVVGIANLMCVTKSDYF